MLETKIFRGRLACYNVTVDRLSSRTGASSSATPLASAQCSIACFITRRPHLWVRVEAREIGIEADPLPHAFMTELMSRLF